MSQPIANPVPPVGEDSSKVIFYHKNGMGGMLRLKEDETLEAAVERLRKTGWLVPDLGQLAIREDEVGKYLAMK